MNSPSPILEARQLGRRAPGGSEWLLRDVCLSVHPGSRLAVAGPSGSGKTLLLRALALLDPLDAGEVRWRQQPLRHRDIPRFRSQVVYLHQRPALREGTVEENLRQPFTFGVHRDRHYDARRISRLLDRLERGKRFLSKDQHDLSGGERQLVALLRILQLDPELLLLDEPTTALDSQAAEAVESLIEHWRGEAPQRRATLWVSHDARQLERVADHVLRMHEGRLDTNRRGAGEDP